MPQAGPDTKLFDHLRKNHVKQYGESLRMRPKKVQSSAQNKPQTQTLQEAFARSTPYGKESQRWKERTAAVTTYICIDMASMYTVEKRGFRELVLTLDPRYQTDMWHVLIPIYMQNRQAPQNIYFILGLYLFCLQL